MKNPIIEILSTEILSQSWATLKRLRLKYTHGDISENQIREIYDRGDGATILLYNPTTTTIILTRQFRLPTYLTGNPTGMMVETCAGSLDVKNPLELIIRETEEETGYRIFDAKKIFELYMSPGSVTEKIHFYTAVYDATMKVSEGGGLETEHEHIEVIEILLEDAYKMFEKGEIKDAKTAILLQYAKLQLISK